MLTLVSQVMMYFFVFSLGTCFGSFYLLVGQRLPRKEDFVKKRSHCENCSHVLAFWELLPVISYLVLRGECRKCQKKIGFLSLGFEIFTGCLFVLTTYCLPFSKETVLAFTLSSLLLIITVTDSVAQKIPNKVLGPFFILALVERCFFHPLINWWSPLLGLLVGFGSLYVLAFFSKGGMAGGDIKLFAVLGVFLGPFNVLLALFAASFLALIYVIGEIVFLKKLRKFIPFGPFIALGTWCVYMHATNQWQEVLSIILS